MYNTVYSNIHVSYFVLLNYYGEKSNSKHAMCGQEERFAMATVLAQQSK